MSDKSASGNKKTGESVAREASDDLRDKSSSKADKSLAGSAVSQSGTDKQTSARVASDSGEVLGDSSSSKKGKSVAASDLSQAPSKKKGD